jgi:hypothetical protein
MQKIELLKMIVLNYCVFVVCISEQQKVDIVIITTSLYVIYNDDIYCNNKVIVNTLYKANVIKI